MQQIQGLEELQEEGWHSFQLSAEAVDRYWEGIETALDHAPHIWERFNTKESLYSMLTTGFIQCWVVFLGEEHMCTYFTKVNTYPSGVKEVTVWWMVGELEDSLPVLCDTMRHFCLSIEAHAFEVEGRPGWERMLKNFGMVKDRVILRKTLTERMH
jgi:hypothetical protein